MPGVPELLTESKAFFGFHVTHTILQVPGNFHVSTHAARHQPTQGDMRHVVHTLRFGQEPANDTYVKGSFNPMENVGKSSNRKFVNCSL